MAEDPATFPNREREQVKSLIAFAQELLTECGERCGVSTDRDAKTVSVRVEAEGISFLTISLANFGSDLQKGLGQGFVDSNLFAGFRRTGGLPRFLGGFLRLIFDAQTGRLLEQPSIDAIRVVRQFTLTFAKIRIECTDTRNKRAISRYLECEQDVKSSDLAFPSFREEFAKMGTLLFGRLLSDLDTRVRDGQLMPRHGNGSTAESTLGNAKWDDFVWTARLDRVFPVMENLVPTYRHTEVLDRVRILEPGDELPVKVMLVPKTLKTPRIIAKEPVCMMFMQLGLFKAITEGIQRDDLLRNLLGYLDQQPNRRLARKGSIDGTLATLDLSEASDRVSNQHVLALTRPWTFLSEGIQACRSRKADVPDHGVIRLAKFASMGSAVCFPMEAMVFTTIVFLGIQDSLNRRLTRRDLMDHGGRVRVYGDDIIVPVEYYSSVVKRLASFGLVVNTAKSYGTGKFRESCGGDYYDGQDVTPVRVREVFPTSRQHVDEIVSAVSLRNQLEELGYIRTAAYVDQILEVYLGPLKSVPRNSSALGRWSSHILAERMHPDYQVPQIMAPVAVSNPRESKLDGYGALLKFFYKDSVNPILDPKHLQRAGRPSAVRIKQRWVRTDRTDQHEARDYRELPGRVG